MKRLYNRLPLALVLLLMLGTAPLAAGVRRAPMAFSAVYVDALASFWMLAILLGTALRLWLWPSSSRRWLAVAITVVCMLSCVVAWPLLFAGFMLLLFFLENERWWLSQPAVHPFSWRALRAHSQSIAALVALFAAMTLLTWGGARRFDAANAGAALTSAVFWLVLIGAAAVFSHQTSAHSADYSPCTIHHSPFLPGQSAWPSLRQSHSPFTIHHSPFLLWLYLLARLYTLGPWLLDWSLALLTLGATLLVWNVILRPHRVAIMASLALIALGLGTSAGIAAACLVVLAMLLPVTSARQPTIILLPFTISFVAFWSVIGAVAASGISVLAGILWLAMLGLALSSALQEQPGPDSRITAVSVVLALISPGMYALLIQPVVEQLQGGLTPYGTLSSWPWLGLAVANSGNRGVAALPLIAIAGLLLVLMAALHLFVSKDQQHDPVWLENRGRMQQSLGHRNGGVEQERAFQQTVLPESQPSTYISTLLALCNEVPWLQAVRSRRGPYEPR